MLVDLCATDYLGWGADGVAGYIGTPGGRDHQRGRLAGLREGPRAKTNRFTVSYHLLRVGGDAGRVRVQAWLGDGDGIDSVVGVWPAADWYEREVFDMMGSRSAGIRLSFAS